MHLTSMDYNTASRCSRRTSTSRCIPGYEHVVTVTPNQSGTYSIICNEYCGINHHTMVEPHCT